MEPMVNKVAESGLLVFKLEDLWDGAEVKTFDIAPFLVEGLVLREKPYRTGLKEQDWSSFSEAHVGVYCSTEAIVPTWAYMLAASRLFDVARSVTFGDDEAVRTAYFERKLETLDWMVYRGRTVVVKGCSSSVVPLSAYVRTITRLQQVAGKVMFGEPCSTVPVWRKPTSG